MNSICNFLLLNRRTRLLVISLVLHFIFVGYCNSQIVYQKDILELNQIGTSCKYFEDKTSKLTASEVLEKNEFISSNQKVPNFGTTSSNIWIKIEIENRTSQKELILDIGYPILEKAIFYKINSNKIADSTSVGRAFPFSSRKFKNQNLLYDIQINSNEKETILIKISSNSLIILPIDLSTIQKTAERLSLKDLLSGFYFGVMVVMLVYNLFIYFTIKDKSYLYYSFYVITVAFTQAVLNGYDIRFFYPDSSFLASYAVNFSGVVSGFGTIMFAQNFLNTKKFTPALNKLLSLLIIMYTGCFLLTCLGHKTVAYHWINFNAGIASLSLVVTAVMAYFKGNKQGLIFLINWSIFLGSLAIYVLKDYGILPFNLFTFNGLQMGSAIEATLFSIALANRINLLRKEKDASQARELLATLENEKIIKEQNVLLEQRVEERTYALNESNEQLQKTLEDLQATQAQLIHSEKMASLGQLTAGVAHEINNPINFVISSISPLKRDLEDMMEILEKYEEIKDDSPTIGKQLATIESLKRQLDLPYLKEEITMLTKGITEGANRTAEIVRGLKNFSRLDESDFKEADVREGLDSTLLLLSNELGNTAVVKEYEEINAIECFPGQLNQVFMNILNNGIYAIKKRYDGTVGGQLKLTIRNVEEFVNIIIEDNGTGMPKDIANKVFEPFYTTKKVGEGTGLGMSITYQIIEKHQGKIFVESELGVGTKFLIYLPKHISPS